jgi:hypothetical protein
MDHHRGRSKLYHFSTAGRVLNRAAALFLSPQTGGNMHRVILILLVLFLILMFLGCLDMQMHTRRARAAVEVSQDVVDVGGPRDRPFRGSGDGLGGLVRAEQAATR